MWLKLEGMMKITSKTQLKLRKLPRVIRDSPIVNVSLTNAVSSEAMQGTDRLLHHRGGAVVSKKSSK